MPTQEIARQEWQEFFDGFSRQHQGWLITMEVLGQDLGDLVEARQLPLAGITVEPGDDGEAKIEIIIGERPDSHISHMVTAPKRIWLKQTEEGADDALEIESEDHAVLLRLSAVRAATVEGLP